MRSYKNWILAVCLIGFIGLGVSNVTKTHNRLQLKDIQLKSTSTQLLNLQLKYDLLNKDLQQQLNSKTQDQDKIQGLQKQIQDLGNQRDQLQQQLQTRADEKAAEEQKIAEAASLSSTAYAAAGCNDAKSCIYAHESGNCPTKWQGEHDCLPFHGVPSDSSGLGYGLCQATPASKMASAGADWATNYTTQDAWCNSHATSYGGWSAAWAFWQAHSWW